MPALLTFAGWTPCRVPTLQVEERIRGRVIAEPLTAFTTMVRGNARTHMMLWEQCSASDATAPTVAEDDAVFNRHFSTKSPQVRG